MMTMTSAACCVLSAARPACILTPPSLSFSISSLSCHFASVICVFVPHPFLDLDIPGSPRA
ncbi:hypothetical protein ACLOJK_010090 [Asimina triloba]